MGDQATNPTQPTIGTTGNPIVSNPIATGQQYGTVTPTTLAQPTSPSVFNTSADLYNQAAAGPNISQFMNPYTQQVTDTTLQGLERQRQMAANTTGAQASAAGAFGGSRHGVADALTNEAFARQGAETLAGLNSQGFNTALSAAQSQQGIQGNLSNLGFGFGQQLNAGLSAAGAEQRSIQQQLLDASRAQYAGYTGAPQAGLSLYSQILSGTPYSTSSTTSQSPGAMGILGGLLSIL